MQPLSMCCDSSSSWVCIGIFKPRRRERCSSEEFVTRISSMISLTAGFVKAAVLKSRISNHVAILSVWEKGTSLDETCEHPKVRHPRKLLDRLHRVIFRSSRRDLYPVTLPLVQVEAYEKALSSAARAVDLSWYEMSCSDCKDKAPSSSLSSTFSSTPLVHGDATRLSSSMLTSPSPPSTLSHSCSFWDSTEKEQLNHDHLHQHQPCAHPSPLSSPSPSTSSLPPVMQRDDERSSSSSLASLLVHSPPSTSSPCLSLGDVVHLRCIEGCQTHLQDVLTYSCLAILKAYFPQTDGLHSYTFYRSQGGSRMVGLGVWRSVDAAGAFLNAPNGAQEERYWRSLGAKLRLGIYEVVALVVE